MKETEIAMIDRTLETSSKNLIKRKTGENSQIYSY